MTKNILLAINMDCVSMNAEEIIQENAGQNRNDSDFEYWRITQIITRRHDVYAKGQTNNYWISQNLINTYILFSSIIYYTI